MAQRLGRRELLVATASSLSLTGCISSSAEQTWSNNDEYPNDENRNRQCEIRSSGTTSGTIDLAPTELGYSPFAYVLSGREDMHGTNQHYNLTVTADSDIRIIGTSIDQAVDTMAKSDRGTLVRPDESKIVKEQTLAKGETYTDVWRVPDGEDHTALFVPQGTIRNPISVQMDIGCSYYLPLEEYKNRTE